MARSFVESNSEYLAHSVGSPVSGAPLSISCWFYGVSNPTNDGLVDLTSAIGSFANRFRLWLFFGRLVKFEAIDFSGGGDCVTSTAYTLNTWNHVLGVEDSPSSRRVRLNNGGEGTSAVSKTPSGVDNVVIGRQESVYMDGRIAEVAVWNAALTNAENAILRQGYSALFVRPELLAAYWTLLRTDRDEWSGSYDMTAFNTPTWADHPPIIYPAPASFAGVPAAVAANIAILRRRIEGY